VFYNKLDIENYPFLGALDGENEKAMEPFTVLKSGNSRTIFIPENFFSVYKGPFV